MHPYSPLSASFFVARGGLAFVRVERLD